MKVKGVSVSYLTGKSIDNGWKLFEFKVRLRIHDYRLGKYVPTLQGGIYHHLPLLYWDSNGLEFFLERRKPLNGGSWQRKSVRSDTACFIPRLILWMVSCLENLQ